MVLLVSGAFFKVASAEFLWKKDLGLTA